MHETVADSAAMSRGRVATATRALHDRMAGHNRLGAIEGGGDAHANHLADVPGAPMRDG
jgi:predicted short-subunit dehydrogenase-like oxidoreductase (DUF2520 family)